MKDTGILKNITITSNYIKNNLSLTIFILLSLGGEINIYIILFIIIYILLITSLPLLRGYFSYSITNAINNILQALLHIFY